MEPTAVLLSPSQTLLSPHTHSEIKLLHRPVCFSINKIWNKYSFPFTRGADSTCSVEVVEGVSLYKSNKADFAVIKFYKVTLTLSWSVLLQTALLINHSRVLTFPDINNTAAPWPEQKGGNGQGFTLSFPLDICKLLSLLVFDTMSKLYFSLSVLRNSSSSPESVPSAI